MIDREHADVESLLGAYVLDAVSSFERRRVQHHISACAQCAREVRQLEETASELAWLPPGEDAEVLIDKIFTSLPRRGRGLSTRLNAFIAAVAAVAIVVAGSLGAALVHQRHQTNELGAITASAARRVPLAPQKGFDGHGVMYISKGRVALVLDQMPPPGRARAYQLWAIEGTKALSMTVMNGHGRVVRTFAWDRPADHFAITIEPAGGSPVPTSEPVLESR
jgi:anti-sigma-K factor RskA